MVVIISPAFTMIDSKNKVIETTKPRFLAQTREVLAELRKLSPSQLESLMKVNPSIAFQAFQSHLDFDFNAEGVPAILAYNGLVYQSLDAEHMSEKELAFANKHLRILSAFYGVLRPCDGILPYRLEMQNRLKVKGKTLYQYWGDTIYKDVTAVSNTIINLASNEYAKCIKPFRKYGDRVIDIEFLVERKGKLKPIVAWTKMARGELAKYIIQNEIDHPEAIKSFDKGYEYRAELSHDEKYVFVLNG